MTMVRRHFHLLRRVAGARRGNGNRGGCDSPVSVATIHRRVPPPVPGSFSPSHRSGDTSPHPIVVTRFSRHFSSSARPAEEEEATSSSSPSRDAPKVDPLDHPELLVQGLTRDDVENDPVVASYMAANFPPTSPDGGDGGGALAELAREFGLEPRRPKERPPRPSDLPPLPPPAEDVGLNVRTLTTYLRDPDTEEGSYACRNLRSPLEQTRRYIPGIVYGADPTRGVRSNDRSARIMVKTPYHHFKGEMDRYDQYVTSRVYSLTVRDPTSGDEVDTFPVLPKDLQLHPVQETLVYCVNFLRYYPGRPVKIPITYVNEEESPALKRGGFIVPIQRYVKCVVEDGVAVPERLNLECTGLQHRDVLRLERVVFPDGVKPSHNVDPDKFLHGSVFGKFAGGGAADEDEEGASGGIGGGVGAGGGGGGDSAGDQGDDDD